MDTEKAKDHWESIYESTAIEETGWYEEQPRPSLKLIEQCDLSSADRIIDVGSGASTLIDALAEKGYRDITAVDVSRKALDALQQRLESKGLTDRVTMIESDVTETAALGNLSPVKLWHDRALLHFLRSDAEREQYARTLRELLQPGGYAIIAEFSPEGVDRCSGLEVQKYDSTTLSELLGDEFTLIEQFDYLYETPSGGERPYIYTLWQREPEN